LAIIVARWFDLNRITRGIVILLVVGASFAFGLIASNYHDRIEGLYRQPIMKVTGREVSLVTPDTPIILEQAYAKCRHIVTSGYEGQEKLVGKSLAKIQQDFPYKDGYLVWFSEDGTLVIHQRIEDWCPADRNRVHLGLFKGNVAVFKGPGGVDEEAVRITGIRGETLPERLRKDLEAGLLEYKVEDEANFVLENLDEYE
jgi:hypothetical protein